MGGKNEDSFFGQEPVLQPAYVIREESLLSKSELSDAQKRGRGAEPILVVCKACSETCFVPGRVRFGAHGNAPMTVSHYFVVGVTSGAETRTTSRPEPARSEGLPLAWILPSVGAACRAMPRRVS